MKNLLYTLLIISLLSGCDKYDQGVFDGPYDTIFPGSYLPVYPGSYWIYNSGTIEYRTSDDYVLHFFRYDEGNLSFESKPCYVPIWNDQPIYRYSSPVGWHYELSYEYYMSRLLSEQLGDRWIDSSISNRYRDFYYYDSVVAVNVNVVSGLNLYDSVIVVEHYGFSNYPSKNATYYYAKNVGLIRVDDRNDSAILVLDSYFINH